MAELIISNENLQKIISEFIPDEHGEITEIGNKEGNSRVFSVGNRYVLRVGNKENKYVIEHEFIKLAQNAGVKTPKLIVASEDLNKYQFAFSLQQKLPGKSLDKLPEKRWPNIFSEVGVELAKLYSIKMAGFGPIDSERFGITGQLEGSFATWTGFVDSLFSKRKNEILNKIYIEKPDNFKTSKLTSGQITKLLTISQRVGEISDRVNKLSLNFDQASMLHGDLQRMNFIVSDTHLSGIIDFEHILVGDPLFDIAVASIMPAGELYKELLNNSGIKINKDRFYLYRLLIAFGKIHTRYVKKNYLRDYPEILDFVLEELDK